MKTSFNWIVFFIIGVFTVHCNEGKDEKPEDSIPVAKSGFDVDERLHGTDSLIVVFYKDPYGKDSVKYTRYYTQISKSDSADIKILKSQVLQVPARVEQFRKCRGEGKIWCYANGKIFQTIYFSMRKPNCDHVYFIKDGFYYYFPVAPSFVTWLSENKRLALDPDQ